MSAEPGSAGRSVIIKNVVLQRLRFTGVDLSLVLGGGTVPESLVEANTR